MHNSVDFFFTTSVLTFFVCVSFGKSSKNKLKLFCMCLRRRVHWMVQDHKNKIEMFSIFDIEFTVHLDKLLQIRKPGQQHQ